MSTLAKIVPIPKGDYSASATYNSLDIVRNSGKTWMCKVDGITGITPASGQYWMLIAQDGGGATALSSLSDVTITSPTNGDILLYNSQTGAWENNAFTPTSSSLSGLTDVSITSAQNNNILLYNAISGKWENGALPVASASNSGCVKVGSGLNINNGTLYKLPSMQSYVHFGAYISGTGSASEGDVVDIHKHSITQTFTGSYEQKQAMRFVSAYVRHHALETDTNVSHIVSVDSVDRIVDSANENVTFTVDISQIIMCSSTGNYTYGNSYDVVLAFHCDGGNV